jgi:aryl-alcohol dehydrogenase-like predicted oxidoreductase
MAIAWCLKNPNVSTAILGASKPEQLKETLNSAEVVPLLIDEVMEKIEVILDNKPSHPPY